jgi:hypothetical protein
MIIKLSAKYYQILFSLPSKEKGLKYVLNEYVNLLYIKIKKMSNSTMNINEENQCKLKEVIESDIKDKKQEDHEQWFMSQKVYNCISKWIANMLKSFEYNVEYDRIKKTVYIFDLFTQCLQQADEEGFDVNDFNYEEVMTSDCFDFLKTHVMQIMFDLPEDGYKNYTPEQQSLIIVNSYTIEKMCYKALCDIYINNYETKKTS